MYDCNKDLRGFHADEVTLTQSERTNMRDHRNANRDRLTARIKIQPAEFIKQGSYAMKTMTQDAENDYDIDDGVYFTRESLQDVNGQDMAPAAARQIVCDALADERFNRPPSVKKNCVRIFYVDGYHVDMPVYRIVDGDYELASGDKWVHSRAADVEEWFYERNKTLSPDETDGRQFRRIVRLLKKFSRSRIGWKAHIASGFTITKLAAEHYSSNADREDVALRTTMQAIYNRLLFNLQVNHPVTPNATLTNGPNDSTTALLRDKLKIALDDLAVLDKADCTEVQARKAWNAVFNTDYFSTRANANKEATKSLLRPAATATALAFPDKPIVPNKSSGFA